MKNTVVTATATAAVRTRPPKELGACCGTGSPVDFNHILNQPQTAPVGKTQQRLGMKLDRFNRKLPMTNTHNDSVVRLGCHFEAGGEFVSDRIERVISAHLKLERQPVENTKSLAPHDG